MDFWHVHKEVSEPVAGHGTECGPGPMQQAPIEKMRHTPFAICFGGHDFFSFRCAMFGWYLGNTGGLELLVHQ
eukprot:1623673-Amphidinium_carterae.1